MSADSRPRACADVLERIVYFLDNELDGPTRGGQVHLDACGPCFERYDLQRTIKMPRRAVVHRARPRGPA